MEKQSVGSNNVYTIDIVHILKCLWKRAWLIALVSILTAAIAFSYAFFFVPPKYSSAVKLYVNNTSVSLGNSKISITPSEISAAQSLIKTYIAILKSRSTLEAVIERADVDYTVRQLYSMITAGSVNDTEIMLVTVTTTNPEIACKIANVIAKVLPIRISEIIDGSSMEVVDSAVSNKAKVSPNFTKYAFAGFALGFIMMIGIIIIIDSLDDTIHDDDYILNQYGCPVLGKVQNLNLSSSKSYKYNYYYGRSSSKSDSGSK